MDPSLRLGHHILNEPFLSSYLMELVETAMTPTDLAVSEVAAVKATALINTLVNILEECQYGHDHRVQQLSSCLKQLTDRARSAHVPPRSRDLLCAPADFGAISPGQRVLSLPDTLGIILSFLPPFDLQRISSTSRAFNTLTEKKRWKKPHDLPTIDHQIRFLFGLVLSRARNPDLPNNIKHLRLRLLGCGWNCPLVYALISLVPQTTHLTLQWGDDDEPPEAVTPLHIAFFDSLICRLPVLGSLSLLKFSPTPSSSAPPSTSTPISLPRSLQTLEINQFHWYWDTIERLVGPNLLHLDLGFGTHIGRNRLAALATALPCLKTLRISCPITFAHIQQALGSLPSLESLHVSQYTDADPQLLENIIPLLTSIPRLRTISLDLPLYLRQAEQAPRFAQPIESISLRLRSSDDPRLHRWIIQLCDIFHRSLKHLKLSFRDGSLLYPSRELVDAFAKLTKLQDLNIRFHPNDGLPAKPVDDLLIMCPNLVLSDEVESLVRGNILFETKYRLKMSQRAPQRSPSGAAR